MFENFDFAVLGDPSFKEDSVREEIVAPILNRLGYGPSGPTRVVRSKALAHPFVMIGSQRHPVKIIPDYTIYVDDRPELILDAKAPTQGIVGTKHVEQAYSYAIHPDIRARHYALCNGAALVCYSLDSAEPMFLVELDEIDSRWGEVEETFLPRFLRDPELRGFFPDYGVTVKRLGVDPLATHLFRDHYLQNLVRVSDSLYTGSSTAMVGSLECLIAFDFTAELFTSLTDSLPANIGRPIRDQLSRQPYQVDLGGKVVFTCQGVLGEETQGAYERFVPVLVTHIGKAHFDPSIELTPPQRPGAGGV